MYRPKHSNASCCIFFLFLILAASLSFADSPSTASTKLHEPNLSKGHSVMKSLSLRKSAAAQDFQKAQDLSLAELSDLLWAANGINRPNESKRTAPSAMNAQDVDIYVIKKSGVQLYDAKNHSLHFVSDKDLRALVADTQTDFASAPVMLLLVSDISKFPRGDDATRHKMGAFDAGIVSQNISLYCSGTGLITRVRMFMNSEGLSKELKLSATQIPMLNHPVGK
jgi:hypothetical protein